MNTKLLPFLFEAKSANETLDKTYDLEKSNVGKGLKTAKAATTLPSSRRSRAGAFEADYEGRVKANEAKVVAVRKEYEHHFGLAKTALRPVPEASACAELLAAKPKLARQRLSWVSRFLCCGPGLAHRLH